jgi:hypothetical protein
MGSSKPTVNGFEGEAAQFAAMVESVALSLPDKARAWRELVRRAAMLEPNEGGFEQTGVLLKQALCQWIDVRSASAHR